jgi:flagellar motor protein MotB
MRDVALMQALEVFTGYGDGRFGPNDLVTRLQLVLLALRVTGLEDEARAMGPKAAATRLEAVFADGGAVPDWAGARECLAYAYEHGLLHGLTHQERNRFRSGDPATRLEVVVTLLQAMGLEEEAQALAGAPISAPDAGAVPAWARGYIALAMELGLLQGDETGALRLGENVTRAQMAALLSRVHARLALGATGPVLVGVLVSVTTGDEATITVQTSEGQLRRCEAAQGGSEAEEDEEEGSEEDADEDEESEEESDEDVDEEEESDEESDEDVDEEEESDEESDEDVDEEEESDEDFADEDEGDLVTVTFPVASDALIFLQGRPATLEDLAPGDRVRVVLSDGVVVFIDVRSEQTEVSGYLRDVEYEGETLVSVTLEVTLREEGEGAEPGTVATFPVSENVTIRFRGDFDSQEKPQVGDFVELKIVHGEVVVLVIGERELSKGEVEGVIVAFDDISVTLLVTKVDWEEGDPGEIAVGAEVTLTFADGAVVYYRALRLTTESLVLDVEVTLKVDGGEVRWIRLPGSPFLFRSSGD